MLVELAFNVLPFSKIQPNAVFVNSIPIAIVICSTYPLSLSMIILFSLCLCSCVHIIYFSWIAHCSSLHSLGKSYAQYPFLSSVKTHLFVLQIFSVFKSYWAFFPLNFSSTVCCSTKLSAKLGITLSCIICSFSIIFWHFKINNCIFFIISTKQSDRQTVNQDVNAW